MSQTAKVFMNGRSQAVRMPAAFRFDSKEVYIRRDPESGDVILSERPDSWDDFFILLEGGSAPEDFLSEEERKGASHRDPFDGWQE